MSCPHRDAEALATYLLEVLRFRAAGMPRHRAHPRGVPGDPTFSPRVVALATTKCEPALVREALWRLLERGHVRATREGGYRLTDSDRLTVADS